MAQRYFNWKLATVLVVAVVVFAVATFALHRWQQSTHADQALPLGEAAYAQKNWEEAAMQFGRYLTVNTDNIAVLLKYAEAQQNRQPATSGHLQQAVAAYRSVLRLEPGNTEAARRLAELYLGMRMAGEAELITERSLEVRDDPVVRRLLALALSQQRKFSEAAKELTGILAHDPNQVLAYELMGRLAELRPDDVNKPAEFWFEEAIKKNPRSALAYIVRAAFRRQPPRNDLAGARADLEQAEKCDLSDTKTRLRLAGEWIDASALDKARAHLTIIQATTPTEPMLWLDWANLAVRANSPEEMYTVAETGMRELAGQPWSFMPTAADLYIRSNHLEKAEDCLSQMRQKDMVPAKVAFLEGLLAQKQGDLHKAVTAWQKALSLDQSLPAPSLPPGTPIMLADAFIRLGDNLSALGQLKVFVSQNPRVLDGHVALLRLLVQMKAWPEVLEEAREVQRLSPGHGEAILLELQAQVYSLSVAGAPEGQEQAWQDVERRLAQLEKDGANPLQVKLLQAQAAVLRRKFAEAESLLTNLESQYPGQTAVLLLHAELYAAQGKEQEAIARFQEVIEKSPQGVEPVRSLVSFLERLNRRDECESVVKQAMARTQTPLVRRDLGLLLGDVYRRGEQQEKLYEWLMGLVAEFPSDIQLKRQLLACRQVGQDPRRAQEIVDEIKAAEGAAGWQWRYEQVRVWITSEDANAAAFKQRHYAQAVKLLQENLLASPDDQRSRLLLAGVHEKGNEPQTALAMYREALARSPGNVQVVVPVVSALYRAGEFVEVEEILDKAKEQGLVHPYLQRLQLQNARRRGDWASASDILEEFLEQDPNDVADNLTLALIRMQEKDFAAAVKILTELHARKPEAMSVVAAQVHLAVLQGHPEEAIRLCDDAVKSLKNALAFLLRAGTYVALKQNDKAALDFDQAVATEPNRAEVWAARSNFRQRVLGRTREAVPDMRHALSLAPGNVLLQKRAVALFLASGEPSLIREAESMVDRRISADSADQQLQLFKAQILLLRGVNPAIAQARRTLREIVDKYPKYADAWEWMVRLELQMGEPGKAVDTALQGLAHCPEARQLLLVKAIAEKESSPISATLTLKGLVDQYPDDLDILIELADAYVRAEKADQAVGILRQGLTKFQDAARRRCEMVLAAALYKNAQRDEAKDLFNALMQAEPNDPSPVTTWAQLLAREKRWRELNQVVSQWRGAHPDDIATTGALASALARTGERDAIQMAEDLLRVMLERNPKSVPTCMLLAMLMQSSGREEEAVSLNRRVLEMDPNNVVAMNNLAWVLCEQKGQYQEALELAEKGLKIAPEYTDLIDTRGMVRYRLGHLDKAVSDFSRCIELYPANLPAVGTSRFNLARAHAELGGSSAEAVRQLGLVVDLCRGYSAKGAVAEARKLLEQVLDLQSRTTELLPEERVTEVKLLLEQLQKRS